MAIVTDVSVSGGPLPPTSWHRHVNLVRELALTQFKLKYTGSVLGYLWSLLKPLMLFAIMYAIFGFLFKLGRTSPNFPIQLLLGIVVWNFFAESTSTAMSSIASNGNLIRKAYFPRAILVVASSLTALITFLINLALIVVIATPFGAMDPGWRSLSAPLFLVELYALILGISLILASLFVFFRDLGHIWEVLSLVLFYGSAVVFPFSLIPGHLLPKLAAMNPVAQVIEDLRHALVTPQVPWMEQIVEGPLYLVPLALTIVSVVVGVLVFNRLSPRFAEEL
jgi:ABC-2 type transport system permease protein